jgi:predicted RNase H-like nuclease (RuvC/YqgF family)
MSKDTTEKDIEYIELLILIAEKLEAFKLDCYSYLTKNKPFDDFVMNNGICNYDLNKVIENVRNIFAQKDQQIKQQKSEISELQTCLKDLQAENKQLKEKIDNIFKEIASEIRNRFPTKDINSLWFTSLVSEINKIEQKYKGDK